ncbi:MAG: hypothetical protein NZ602_12005 [Thermoguttaceae bacterium]|nr:hypothetical protein [Thermoguttaceae bacterium]
MIFKMTIPGEYKFKCQVGSSSEYIRVIYVVPNIKVPKYFFANAEGRIPVELELLGTDKLFDILRDPTSGLWNAKLGLNVWDSENGKWRPLNAASSVFQLIRIAPSWEDNAYALSNRYVGVTEDRPLRSWGEREKGIWELGVRVGAVITLKDGEHGWTNQAVIDSAIHSPEGPRSAIGWDRRYKNVCHIGRDRNDIVLRVLTPQGWSPDKRSAGYEHLSTLQARCETYPQYKPDNEGHFLDENRHIHPAASEDGTPLAPPGFAEQGDLAIARCTDSTICGEKNFAGPTFECKLKDSGGAEKTGEEYVAHCHGGGIWHTIVIAYKLRDSNWFGTFWDIENTTGQICPEILNDVKIYIRINAPNPMPDDGFEERLSFTFSASGALWSAVNADPVGYILSIASLLTSFPESGYGSRAGKIVIRKQRKVYIPGDEFPLCGRPPDLDAGRVLGHHGGIAEDDETLLPSGIWDISGTASYKIGVGYMLRGQVITGIRIQNKSTQEGSEVFAKLQFFSNLGVNYRTGSVKWIPDKIFQR